MEKLVIIKITLIKVLYLYFFGNFCSKKMLDVDLQSWVYVFAGLSCGPLVLIKCNKNMGDFSDSMEEVLLSKKKCLLSVTPTFYPSRFLFFKHILRDLVLQ